MNKDQDAFHNIAETLAAKLPKAEVLGSLSIESVAGLMIGRVALPEGWKLDEKTYDFEPHMAAPRTTKASAAFADTESFLAYIARHANDGTIVWCNFDPQSFALDFTAVIDEHAKDAPAWRKHRATYKPAMSAEWKAWKGKDRESQPQLAFAEWLQEHDEDIHAAEGYPTSLQMLSMATEFVANAEKSLKSSLRLQSGGVRLTYVDTDDDSTQAAMTLFDKFRLGIPVFHGGSGWPIDARLKYSTAKGALSFRYELVRADRVHEHAAKKLIETVRAGIGKVPLLMGACT